MPIYEYACETCKHQFELIQKFSDTPVTECPLCKGPVRKLISSPGIMFKGSGWYVTDYSDKFKNKSATPSPAPPPPSSKPESKPEPKPKPESKPEPEPKPKPESKPEPKPESK